MLRIGPTQRVGGLTRRRGWVAAVAQSQVWSQGRGFERLLARETNISDLIQFCTERDPGVWEEFVGFTPDIVGREERPYGKRPAGPGIADIVLRRDENLAVVEVKLGHTMDDDQQLAYEEGSDAAILVLAALENDRSRVTEQMSPRWRFVSLSTLFSIWASSPDNTVRAIAREIVTVLKGWEDLLKGVFRPSGDPGAVPLSAINHKFLARLVTRRIRDDLKERRPDWVTHDGVTSGGGLALVQAQAPINGDTNRCLQAEMRWWETKIGGELRFGVDFDLPDSAAARREAYDLARSMESIIDTAVLLKTLATNHPAIVAVLDRKGTGRPLAKGDWELVVDKGFQNLSNPDGVAGNRRSIKPDFYGDGTQRYQAICGIDFARASARDVVEAIDVTLHYLERHVP